MPDIVLRDRSGNPLNFYGAEYLDAVTPDGIEIPYAAYDPETLIPENLAKGVTVGDVTGTMSAPESVETTVELDFSGGDMAVTPESGKVFSAVNIPVPANLTPENIAEGVDIAGIIGTLAASSGGGGNDGPVKMWSKTITGVSLTSSSGSQSKALLATPSELPNWAELSSIQRVYALNSGTPVYLLGLFAVPNYSSGYGKLYELWASVVTNFTTSSSAAMGGFRLGKSFTASAISTQNWFETITSSYYGVCVSGGHIYAASYNGYAIMSDEVTYQLILIKIDPTA